MSDRLSEDASKLSARFGDLKAEVGKVLVGQDEMLHRLVLGLLAGGHVLLEGVPGLAKTLVIKTLASALDGTFSRIQFTPDMLPGDIVGTQIFNPREGVYTVRKGPVFGNLILADEINRAPAKVQSALLEAMQERQVTLGDQTFKLAEPFLVLATQNPIEQEGTYPLPEAQLDRFLLKIKVGYPTRDEEVKIIDRMAGSGSEPSAVRVLGLDEVLAARDLRLATDPRRWIAIDEPAPVADHAKPDRAAGTIELEEIDALGEGPQVLRESVSELPQGGLVALRLDDHREIDVAIGPRRIVRVGPEQVGDPDAGHRRHGLPEATLDLGHVRAHAGLIVRDLPITAPGRSRGSARSRCRSSCPAPRPRSSRARGGGARRGRRSSRRAG